MTQKQVFQLPIGPGLYTEQTERGAVGRWFKADKVRFRKGLAEKIGGWIKLQPEFIGICRRLKDWSSLDAKQWSAVATDTKLYLWQDGVLYDITPLRDSGTLTAPFDTVLSSSIVTVNHVNHGGQVGDYVRFSGAIAGGGLTIDGEYRVNTSATDSYTIVDDQVATSTGNNTGGTPSYEYDISAGATSATTATGYGTGPYSAEGYGNARTGSTLVLGIRTWSLDTWGEDLLACPRSGKLYWWDRSKGTGTRAEALGGDAPSNNEYLIVSQRDRHVIALGAFDFFNNTFDPMLIRWSSTEDLNDWVPTSTNTSGDLRLYSGSKIVSGVRSRLETIIFTDVSVHTLPFIGGFDVFGLNIVGENVSILSPNCAVPIDHRVLFMAESDFYLYDGIVRVVPCDVRNFVYDNLNVTQKDKVHGGLNREFNEVWWFYPSFDVDAWVQQDFSLGLPPGYQIGPASNEPPSLFNDVVFQADYEGANLATTYTEESQFAEAGTFTGAAQISTTSPVFDTSSLAVDKTANSQVSYALGVAATTAWDGTGKYMTFEGGFRSDTLPTTTFDDRDFILVGDDDFQLLRFRIEWSSGSGLFIRAGFANSGGIINLALTAGVDYFIAIEADYTAGAGNGVERVWIGTVASGTAALINTATGLTAKTTGGFFTKQILQGKEGFGTEWLGAIDHARVTVSDTARYGTGASITIPTVYETSGGAGGPGDVGYTYGFNSGGYTEIATVTGQNGYDYTYTLTNEQPFITPSLSEYAVEFDWNPSRAVDANEVGLVFLFQDIVGTVGTISDSFKGFIFSMDFDADALHIRKRNTAGVLLVPTNAGTGNAVFSTITGAAPVLGTKYIFKAQVNVDQITLWVDDVQAFQFTMTAQELLDHTGGTSGYYVQQDAGALNQARFYNFSGSPVGVITATDFDISPIEVNRYVAFNYEEGSWTTGKMARTAWADRSPLLEKAYAAGTDGFLYQHETGTDDDGAAMVASIESFDMEIPSAGEELMHVDQLIPDFLTLEGSVDTYLTGKKYPGVLTRQEKGPYPVVPGTRKLSTRIRARQISLKIESTNIGDKWRMGHWRGRAGPHGKRG